jgi:hypothetical protein
MHPGRADAALPDQGHPGFLAIGAKVGSNDTLGRKATPLRLHANHVSVGEAGGEYFEVSFESEAPSDDDFDLSGPDHPYLIVQRQFEDEDGGVCYIESRDHYTYTGHFRLRLIEFTPTRLVFEIARTDHKYVEVTYDLDAKHFSDVQHIVHIIFGVQD